MRLMELGRWKIMLQDDLPKMISENVLLKLDAFFSSICMRLGEQDCGYFIAISCETRAHSNCGVLFWFRTHDKTQAISHLHHSPSHLSTVEYEYSCPPYLLMFVAMCV